MLLLDVTYIFSVSDIVFMGHLHPKQLIGTVCIIVVFEQEVYILMYCLQFMSKKDTTRYHDIDRYADHIYVMRSADVVSICISHIKKTCCVVHLSGLA